MSDRKPYWLDFNDPDCSKDYLPVLKGPNGFECVLTEPEDRTFTRDASSLVDELNRLVAHTKAAEAKLAELERGEYICKQCGLRKDAEVYGFFEKVDF